MNLFSGEFFGRHELPTPQSLRRGEPLEGSRF
jgi:hypothetical protein